MIINRWLDILQPDHAIDFSELGRLRTVPVAAGDRHDPEQQGKADVCFHHDYLIFSMVADDAKPQAEFTIVSSFDLSRERTALGRQTESGMSSRRGRR